jgi:hypothetical protein
MNRARRIWVGVRAFAVDWFFDEQAFTFKGVTTLGVQLLGVLAVLVSVQLFRQPVVVIAENVDPVACLDVAQYEERFALAGETYSEQLREAVKGLVLRDWPVRIYRFTVGAESTLVPTDPSKVDHHILCWYEPPRSERRKKEVAHLRSAALSGARVYQSSGVEQQIERARRDALGTEASPRRFRQREVDATSALLELRAFGSGEYSLAIEVVMAPTDSKSLYWGADRWKGPLGVAEISGIGEVIQVVESSGVKGLELAWALENISDARWFINWLEVRNESNHAIAEKVTVSVNHSGRGAVAVLDGTVAFTRRGPRFGARVEKLLPRETVWTVFRSKQRILPEELQVISDPTPVLDWAEFRWFVSRCYLPVVVLIGGLWVLGNRVGRARRTRDLE